MSAPHVHRARRLAALLSLRTISGKLIIGLVVLFGRPASWSASVTAKSLNNSLMSSLNTELQAATMRWQNCVFPPQGRTMPTPTGGRTDPAVNCYGQATGTFEAGLTGGTFSNISVVPGVCQLSAADEMTLLSRCRTTPATVRRGRPGPADRAAGGRARADLYRDA